MKTPHILAASLLLAFNAAAVNVVVDDFAGGPHTVSLTSLAPPEIALGSFVHGPALGGIRDAAVWSTSAGSFAAGVAFSAGGYASFAGTGAGGVVWDGVAGITDGNGDNTITADELDYGLTLDLSDCLTGRIELSAFTDLTTAVLRIGIATDAANYNLYDIPLTGTVNQFNAYTAALGSPTSTVGAIDWANIGAVAMFIDATSLENLDVRVESLAIACPDGGLTLGMLGFGLLGTLVAARRK
jgi:hypothetical protein